MDLTLTRNFNQNEKVATLKLMIKIASSDGEISDAEKERMTSEPNRSKQILPNGVPILSHWTSIGEKKGLRMSPKPLILLGSGGWIRTNDLRVMSLVLQ